MRYLFAIVRRSFCAVNVPQQTFWGWVRICRCFCRDLSRDLSGKIQILPGFGKGNGKEKTCSPGKKRNFAAKSTESSFRHKQSRRPSAQVPGMVADSGTYPDNTAGTPSPSEGDCLHALWCRLCCLVQAPPGASRAGAVRTLYDKTQITHSKVQSSPKPPQKKPPSTRRKP